MLKQLSMDYDYAYEYIENHLDKRQVNKIQHSFPSPRFWSQVDVPVHETLADRGKLHSMGLGSPVNLYVGVPYCIQTNPGKCGYCLREVQRTQGKPHTD